MLSFDVQTLERQAAAVDGQVAPDDPVWQEGDLLPAGPIAVRGRLSSAGPERFYFHGHLTGTAAGECRRCLADVTTPVDIEAHVVFSADAEDADDAADAYLFDPAARELDLAPAVREEWLLHAPAFPLCREDCAGLCPRCGADRNVADACHCAPEGDPRLAALRDLTAH